RVTGFAENTRCRSNQQSVAALLSRNNLEEFSHAEENAREDMINRVPPLPERHGVKWNISRLPRSRIRNECIDSLKPLERLIKQTHRFGLACEVCPYGYRFRRLEFALQCLRFGLASSIVEY